VKATTTDCARRAPAAARSGTPAARRSIPATVARPVTATGAATQPSAKPVANINEYPRARPATAAIRVSRASRRVGNAFASAIEATTAITYAAICHWFGVRMATPATGSSAKESPSAQTTCQAIGATRYRSGEPGCLADHAA
jgi:hypothetical protein